MTALAAHKEASLQRYENFGFDVLEYGLDICINVPLLKVGFSVSKRAKTVKVQIVSFGVEEDSHRCFGKGCEPRPAVSRAEIETAPSHKYGNHFKPFIQARDRFRDSRAASCSKHDRGQIDLLRELHKRRIRPMTAFGTPAGRGDESIPGQPMLPEK